MRTKTTVKKNWIFCKCEGKCENLDSSVVKCRVPDFKSMDKNEFMTHYKLLAPPVLLEKIWKFGNDQWADGYRQGCDNPDFD